jgi:hypothetical protein
MQPLAHVATIRDEMGGRKDQVVLGDANAVYLVHVACSPAAALHPGSGQPQRKTPTHASGADRQK